MVLDVRRTGLGERLVPYGEAWEEQRRLHAAVVDGTGPDTVLLLEHEPVYTAGKRTNPADRPLDGTPVVDVDRGGSITFHGPGQLVGYPIVRLPEHVFVVDHLRRVEEVMIRAARDLGVPAGRVPGRSGAWVGADARGPARKLGAIGIRVSQHVSMHGFALNCDVDEQWFGRIVPCGIADAGTTSLAAELGRPVTLDEAADAVEPHLRDLLAWGPFERSPDLLERPPATDARDDQPLASLIRIASR